MEEHGDGEVVHESGGLEDGVGEGGLDEALLDVALAVVVEEFAELGVQHAAEDEVFEGGGVAARGVVECSVDHHVTYFALVGVERGADVDDDVDVVEEGLGLVRWEIGAGGNGGDGLWCWRVSIGRFG